MAILEIRKKSNYTWLHIDSELGEFILSQFYFSEDGTKFQIVEQGQSKRRIYDVTTILVYDDVNGGPAESFATITELSMRLEELFYPAFDFSSISPFDPTAAHYKGKFNATTNTPTLADGIGSNGDIFKVSVGDTIDFGSGPISLRDNDFIIYDAFDGVWGIMVDNNQTEGLNIYFKGKFTSLANLQAAFPTANDGDYAIVDSGIGVDALEYIWDADEGWVKGNSQGASTTDALPEGITNLYFTPARVLATLLTGISFATGTVVTAADSIIIGFGKFQKQINDILTAIGLKENSANKQNSLATDGTGTKFPTVDATKAEFIVNESESVRRTAIDFLGKDIDIFGDSYVAGSGSSGIPYRFTTILCKALGATEVNHGVPGTTIQKRSPIDYIASPNMVDNVTNIPTKTASKAMLVFAFGLNDMGQTASAYNVANFITDYNTVLANAISKGWYPSQILLIPAYYIGSAGYDAYATITGNAAPTTQRHLDFIEATRKVADDNGTMFIDIYQDQKKNNTTLIDPDNIHATNAGHAYIAKDILQYLSEHVSDIQLYVGIAGNTTLDSSYHGKTVYVVATCTITIPTGLRPDFNACFRTFTGATATFATSGTTINSESDTSIITPKKMCYVSVYTTNNYIISGG